MVPVNYAALPEHLQALFQGPPSCSCSSKQSVFISLLLVCFQTDSMCQGCFHQEPWKSNTLVIKSHHSRASAGQCIWRIDQLISSATFIYFKLNTWTPSGSTFDFPVWHKGLITSYQPYHMLSGFICCFQMSLLHFLKGLLTVLLFMFIYNQQFIYPAKQNV